MDNQDVKIEHEYTEHGLCKYCGWEQAYIEMTSRLCTESLKNQHISELGEAVNIEEQNYIKTSNVDLKESNSSDGLFSDGFFGLLNKGPVGWTLFGLIAGILYGIYKSILGWIN